MFICKRLGNDNTSGIYNSKNKALKAYFQRTNTLSHILQFYSIQNFFSQLLLIAKRQKILSKRKL